MSEEIKYEPVFGDQSLFDMAGDYDVLAVLNGKSLFHFNEKELKTLNKSICKYESSTAMRRIIRTPVWTKADQQAGRLPEVGAKHGFVGLSGVFTCLFIDCAGFVWSFGENNEVYCSEDNALIALETDAERQQRKREEWCNNATKLLKNLEYTSTLTSIYDALQSGELEMPEVRK